MLPYNADYNIKTMQMTIHHAALTDVCTQRKFLKS